MNNVFIWIAVAVALLVFFAGTGSTSARSSLWILSRTAEIPAEKREMLVEQAARWGFDVTRLEYP